MSKINLHNYEAFMLDHLEGNLSAEDTKALKAFALLHPELELNFDEELVTLEAENLSFDNKQNLKAGFSDELVIGYLENVLDGQEKQQADVLAKNNTIFKQELELYKKTILVADKSIVFENKEDLKRRPAIIFLPQSNFVRIAAALLLLLGLWFMVARLIKDDVNVSPQMANKEKEIPAMNTGTISNNVGEEKETPVVKEEKKLVAKKMNTNNVIKKEKEINTSTVNVIVPDKKEEPQLVNDTKKEEQPKLESDSNATAKNTSLEKVGPKYIIEEGQDEEQVASKPKSKLWNFASGMMKRLNRRGVENVNSSEENNAILIGALTISKPN